MRKLALHLLGYALLLAAIAVVIPLDSSFGSDDGAYGGEVYALQHGEWALDRPLPVVAQPNEGWFNASITPDGPVPYATNPAYPLALSAVAGLIHGETPPERAGDLAFGLHLLPLLGGLASAGAAWLLASHWRPAAAPLAFWLTALGPVLVNSTTLWAHSLSTAVGGMALVFMVKMLSAELPSRRVMHAGALMTTLALGVPVRTEAVFWVAAVCVAIVVLDRSRFSVAVAAASSVLGAMALAANRLWSQSVRADALPVETRILELQGSPGWLQSRLPAAWQLLLTSLGDGRGPLLAIVALALAVGGAIRLRQSHEATDQGRHGRPDALAVGLLVASALTYVLRAVLLPGTVISGTLAAWPAVLVLIVAGWQRGKEPEPTHVNWRRALLVPMTIMVASVVVTQYAGSGGHQWGGRYLSMAFVATAVVAALCGHHLLSQYRLPMLSLLVAPAVVGVVASYNLHTDQKGVVDALTAEGSEVVITPIPAMTRVAWAELPTTIYLADSDTLDPLLADLAEAGVATVTVHDLPEVDLETSGYEVESSSGSLRHLRLNASADAFRPSPVAPGEGP